MTMQTIVLGFAWFTIANCGASMFSWLLASPSMQGNRPRRMVLTRLFPACSSVLFAGIIFLPTHLVLEPPDANESLGLSWYVLAGSGAFLLGRSVSRAVSFWRAGRELLRPGHRAATGIPGVHEVDGISGVSLAGVFKPRIVIGPEIVGALTAAELDAAIAHELAHRDACDNVTRAAMLCAPDLFGGSRRAEQLEKAWHEAAESLADSRAVGSDRVRAVHLASALVKVARLSASAAAPPQPAWSTLNDPPLLERRVRRLVSGALTPATPYRRRVRATLVAAGGIILVCIPLTGGSVHRLTEYLVQLLP